MKALLLKAPYELELIECEKPVPQKGEALVRVLSAAICGSEIHGYRGKHFGRKPPAIMGHEVCGVVEALGEDTEGPAVGTRVVAIPQRTCRTCHWCKAGMPNLCSQRLMLGFTKWPGAYEDYFVIPADLLQTELDVCWVKVAGQDPAAYIRRYAGGSDCHLPRREGKWKNRRHRIPAPV